MPQRTHPVPDRLAPAALADPVALTAAAAAALRLRVAGGAPARVPPTARSRRTTPPP